MLRSILAAAGYKVIETSTIAQTAAELLKGSIDVLIADAATATATDGAGVNTILIAHTPHEALRAPDPGHVLTTPIQPDALLRAVENAVLTQTAKPGR